MSEDSSKQASIARPVNENSSLLIRFFGQASKPAKNLGPPWLIILSTLLIFLLSQFVAALLVGIGNGILHPHASLSDALNDSASVQFFYVLLAEGLAAGLVIWLVKKVRKVSLSVIGLGRRPVWRDFRRAFLGAIAFYAILIVVSILVTTFVPSVNTKETQDVGFNTLNTSTDQLLAFVALVFLPPIGEEILVRGYLYSGLRAYWRFVWAMLVTSLLFGAAHLGSGSNGGILWIAGIDTFLLSLVLVYLREKTGALYAGMLVHAANNVIAFSVHFHGLMF